MRTEPGREPAVIFLHLHKTAGTSLRELLRSRYREEEVYVESPPPEDRIRASVEMGGEGTPVRRRPPAKSALRYVHEIEAIPPEERRRLRLLMGHFWFGVHELLEQPSTYVTILRDPVERTLSLYHHLVRFYGLGIGLERFVSERRYRFDNEQTRRIAGGLTTDRNSVDCTPELLEVAKRHLRERFAVVGVTERFEETLLLLGKVLGLSHLASPRLNVSDRPRRDEVPKEAIERIEALTVYDSELHRFAEALLEERLASERLRRDVERF